MSKTKSITAGLGLAVGFVAMVAPMTTFAEDLSGSDTLGVEVNIDSVISMRIVSTDGSGSDDATCDSRDVVVENNVVVDNGCTGDAQSLSTTILPSSEDTTSMSTNIYVSTNSTDGYSLTLIDSDAVNSLTNGAGNTIAAISSLPVGGSNPGWAISTDDGANWQAVPISTGSAIVVENYAPNPKATADERQSTIKYGIAASSDQPTGTYSDTIVYTATAH